MIHFSTTLHLTDDLSLTSPVKRKSRSWKCTRLKHRTRRRQVAHKDGL